MYKDKDKQREANRKAQAKFKARVKGITETVTPEGITNQLKANQVIPNMRRGKDIQCFADLPPDVQATINRLSDNDEEHARRTAAAIKYQHLFPDHYHCTGTGLAPGELVSNPVPVKVSLPGDADYVPLCETTRKLYPEKV